ncbi:porin [Ningiella sp. W23]|uniref:porin n=1 Tax=Ningiella sp. W23 TaxID=3023715 RepID=UPI003757B895
MILKTLGNTLTITLFGALLILSHYANAEKAIKGDPLTQQFDDIWSFAELYGEPDKKDEPFIKLRGRYHGQQYWADGDDSSDNDWENRRVRLGLGVRLSERLDFAFEFNMYRQSGDNVINNFDFISLNYALSDNTELSVGKLRRNPLTREDGMTSNKILTLERSILTTRFFMDNVGGVYVEHKEGDWTLGGGVLKGSSEDDLRLPSLDGATMVQLNVAKQISKATEIRLDYLNNSGDPDNNEVEPYRHVVSLNSSTRSGRWGLMTDLIYAAALPEARGDLFGIVLLPHYMLTERLQVVGRYTYTSSNEDNGIRLPRRYERGTVAEGFEFGDNHQAFYAGLNYYFYGHNFKVMSGLEYTDFDSVNGNTSVVTASAAIRMYF